MSARSTFYERIGLIRELSSDSLLTDTFPPNNVHNIRATILRNGLVVSAFSLLESYLEDRIEENIADLSSARMHYTMFGDKLRRLLSHDAIIGLGNRIGFVDKADRLLFAETNIARLAGHANSPIGYTGLGFSPKGSNISVDSLQTLLAAFDVQQPWLNLSTTATRLGASRVSLQTDFINLLRNRNKAAHDSTTNTPTSDLQTHIDTALLVGMSVDIMLTNAVSAFAKETTLNAAVTAANSFPPNYRFLDESTNNEWKEKVGANGRTIKKYPSKQAAKSGAQSRTSNDLIILRDTRSIPIELL